jgi:ATP-dependent protease ClpP protease subunit
MMRAQSASYASNEEEQHTESNIHRENNHIYFHTEVDRKSISDLIRLIREAESYCLTMMHQLRVDSIPIYLHIYSDGGLVYAAFLAMDVIRACSVPVYSVIEGSTASAGTLMSIVCTKRFIRPSAYMLIHQIRNEIGGKMTEIVDEYKNTSALMESCRQLYTEHTNLSARKLEKLLSHEIWLNATQVIQYGLADELYH